MSNAYKVAGFFYNAYPPNTVLNDYSYHVYGCQFYANGVVGCAESPTKYEWRSSRDGIKWSEVLSTSLNYSNSMPSCTGFFLKFSVIAANGSSEAIKFIPKNLVEKPIYFTENTIQGNSTQPLFNTNSIAPNPAQNLLEISYTAQKDDNVIINITNNLGQAIKSQSLKTLFDGTNISTLDVSELQNGTYFLQIKGNSIQSSKIFQIVK